MFGSEDGQEFGFDEFQLIVVNNDVDNSVDHGVITLAEKSTQLSGGTQSAVSRRSVSDIQDGQHVTLEVVP